jgi:hypothetical protein
VDLDVQSEIEWRAPLSSNQTLTFWICAARPLTIALKASVPFRCPAFIASRFVAPAFPTQRSRLDRKFTF